MTNVHPTAIIDPAAVVAETAEIGAYCVIGPEVVIGERTVLHHHVVVQSLTTIGDDNEIFPFAVLGADPQDMKFAGERATCVIGHRNRIREHVTIHRGTANGGGVTRIGNDNLLMVAAHVAHDSIVGNEIVLANQVMIAGHVRIHDGASIGGGAGLHHFVTIGKCAFVGGLARITKDVPPFMIVEGHPARVRKVNIIGLERGGVSRDEIQELRGAYRRLFRSAEPQNRILSELEATDYGECVGELIAALRRTELGSKGRYREVLREEFRKRGEERLERVSSL